MNVRIGVIGVGYLGRHHARIYSEIDGVTLVSVADPDTNKSGEIAQTYGCKSFSGYQEMLELCDALSIVTPTTSHHKIAEECIKAGKDIFIEKPITENILEARDLVAKAREQHLILQVGHLERYNPGIIAASDMIHSPRFIESERLSPFQGRGTDVDVTLDLMIHDIDIVISLVRSKLKDLHAIGESVITDRIDVAKAWLEFENGCHALITASRLAPEKKRTLKVFQKDAYLLIDYQNHTVKKYYKGNAGISTDIIQPEKKEPLKEELMDFIHCVKTRTRPKVSGIEATEALEVAIMISDMLKSN